MGHIKVMRDGKWEQYVGYNFARAVCAEVELKTSHICSAMVTAHQISTLSHCERRKAGAVIICIDDVERRPRVLGWGVNGMPAGEDNCCELPAPEGHVAPAGDSHPHLVTNSKVIHAEVRAIEQALRTGVDPRSWILLCTDSPCPECAKVIDAVGIPEVYCMFAYHTSVSSDAKFRLLHIDPKHIGDMYHNSHLHLQQRILNEA